MAPSLFTEWVDYVEEPMKYQAFLHHFDSVGGVGERIMGWVGGGGVWMGWWWWWVGWGWWQGWGGILIVA